MDLLVALAAGVLFGAGVVAIGWGIQPPLPPLGRRVALVLSDPPPVTAGGQSRPRTVWTAWRDRLAARTKPGVLPDLALLERTPADLVAERLAWAAGTTAGAGLLAALAGAGPWLVPAIAIAAAAGGWQLGLHEMRDRAAKRRRSMGLALAAWAQMTAMLIRAGVGTEQAMRQAAGAGSHWSFGRLAGAMATAADNRQFTWQGLADLGEHTDVVELRQLAAELRLTQQIGGTPADGLLARARALRDQEVAELTSAARTAEIKQAIPLIGLLACLATFIIYPTVKTLVG